MASASWAIGETWALPRSAWIASLKETWSEIGKDNIGLIAAGVAFYAFAAVIPLLAAVVLIYGLVADAATVNDNIRSLLAVMPADAARSIGDQLATVVRTSGGKKGLGLALAIVLALYGATKGTSAMVIALNVAFGEEEKRGFIKLNLLALAMVIGAVVVVLIAMGTTAVLAFLEHLIPSAPGIVLVLIRIGSYLVLALLVTMAAAALYRFAPCLSDPRFQWITPGAAAATLLWLAGTALFGLYVSHFGNYGATYGSLSAVIVLLTWLWLSAYVFLAGGEFNAALAHQLEGGAAKPAATSAPAVAAQSPRDAQIGSVATGLEIKAASRVGGAKLGLPSALLAGAGMSRLRRGSASGFAMVAGAVTLAWLRRKRD